MRNTNNAVMEAEAIRIRELALDWFDKGQTIPGEYAESSDGMADYCLEGTIGQECDSTAARLHLDRHALREAVREHVAEVCFVSEVPAPVFR